MTFDRITAVSNTLESRLHNAKTNFKKGIFVICQCKDEKCEIDISHTEPIKSTLQTLFMKQSHLDLLTVFLAETIGTAILVLLGCMGCVEGFGFQPNHFTICITFGLAVMVIVNTFGVISGSHVNPAVTVAAIVYKLVSIPTGIVYMIGQLLGGFLGYGFLMLLTPSEFVSGDSFCVSLPSPHVSTMQAFMVEFAITSILTLICCGVWDPRNAKHFDSVPLRFGLAISVLALAGGPYSGGSMNPARSFGPALYHRNWQDHWIYWIAPLSSALITAVTFKAVFWRDVPKPSNDDIEEHPLRDNNKQNDA